MECAYFQQEIHSQQVHFHCYVSWPEYASLCGIYFWQQRPIKGKTRSSPPRCATCCLVLLVHRRVCAYCFVWHASQCQFLHTIEKNKGKRKCLHPRNLTLPLKIGLPKRNLVFQPSIFGGYVKFGGCNLSSSWFIIPKNHEGPSQKKNL